MRDNGTWKECCQLNALTLEADISQLELNLRDFFETYRCRYSDFWSDANSCSNHSSSETIANDCGPPIPQSAMQ